MIADVDGHDAAAVEAAIVQARKVGGARPSLICCKTVIGKGAPHEADTGRRTGDALGADEVAATRASIRLELPAVRDPASVYADWNARERGRAARSEWDERFAALCAGAS